MGIQLGPLLETRQIKVEELNNGVVPKKTLVEIGKGWDKKVINFQFFN